MIIYLKFLGQLNFIGVQTQIPTQNSPSWSRRKAKFLWTTRNWLPRVFPYTLTHSSDVFSRPCVSATYWYWLIIYRTGWLEFGHQTSNTRQELWHGCGEDKNHVMRGTFLERSTDFDNKILWFVHDDCSTLWPSMVICHTTKQFTTNLTDVTLTTWLLWSNKFRTSLLKDSILIVFREIFQNIRNYNRCLIKVANDRAIFNVIQCDSECWIRTLIGTIASGDFSRKWKVEWIWIPRQIPRGIIHDLSCFRFRLCASFLDALTGGIDDGVLGNDMLARARHVRNNDTRLFDSQLRICWSRRGHQLC